jgi:hypothetical protein
MTKAIADELINNDPWDCVEEMIASKKIKYKKNFSVVCRLLDSQREVTF